MSVRIFKDIEEALEREVRRLTYHDKVTRTETVLQDAFDPFTGEVVQIPLEAQFYDSSANTQSIDYPNIFVKLLRTREDRFSGKIVSQYGRDILVPVANAPKAYEIIASNFDGTIVPGNDLITSLLKIHKVAAGNLLRILSGTNQGTYTIVSRTPDSGGSHVITVSPDILSGLPTIFFDPITREVVFEEDTDLNTVRVGDDFIDASLVTFSVVSVDPTNNKIEIGGITTPDISSGGTITRPGNVFVNDPDLVKFLVLDKDKPILVRTASGDCESTSAFAGVSPSIPLDVYYLIRIDSKERQTHIEILNRMWEEFNPPRTGLPVVVRSALSAETDLTADVTSGGSQTLDVGDNTEFKLGDPIFVFDDLTPTKQTTNECFDKVFTTCVSGKIGTNQLVVKDVVPDTFVLSNCARVVSNAELQILMFHFVDHKTRDVEAAQYWVHEFTFWVQTFVDRLGDITETGVVTNVGTELELGVDC